MRTNHLKPRSSLVVSVILVILILIPIAAAGWAIDFGEHGDELLWIGPISESIEKSTFLPERYNYPSIVYDLGLATLMPYGALSILRDFDSYSTNQEIGETFTQILDDVSQSAWDNEYRLVLRIVFAILSSLSFLWIYLLVLKWRRSQAEAILSVALLAGSWELNYHSRYIAPDALLMQFGVLTMMLLIFSEKAESRARKLNYHCMASIAAGLAFGTKYQGALFLIPVILSAVLNEWSVSVKKWHWRELINLILVFLITFIITTPGAILQFPLFVRDLGYELIHYSTYGHGAHTVAPGIEHLQLMLGYLGREALSNYPAVSMFLALVSILGIYSIWKSDRRLALILLSVPVTYLLFVSRQRVMFIRNLLLLFPFLAIFAARGIFVILEGPFFLNRVLRIVAFILIGVVWLANATWLLEAANSIVNPTPISEMELLARYIDQRPQTEFYMSDTVLQDLLEYDPLTRPNIVMEPGSNVEYIYYGSDLFNILSEFDSRPLINRSDFYSYLLPSVRENSNYFDVSPTGIIILDHQKLTQMGIDIPLR